MKYKNIIILLSVLVSAALVTHVYLKDKQAKDAYANSSFGLQGDLVQLESAIEYQSKNNWREASTVLEKIEDVKESINGLMVTGKDSGMISENQEKDLWKLYDYFSKYPAYTGFPNSVLNPTQREELTSLGDHLKSVGWSMNVGYQGDWKSFSMKIDALKS